MKGEDILHWLQVMGNGNDDDIKGLITRQAKQIQDNTQ